MPLLRPGSADLPGGRHPLTPRRRPVRRRRLLADFVRLLRRRRLSQGPATSSTASCAPAERWRSTRCITTGACGTSRRRPTRWWSNATTTPCSRSRPSTRSPAACWSSAPPTLTAPLRRASYFIRLPTPPEWVVWLQAAGFHDVRVPSRRRWPAGVDSWELAVQATVRAEANAGVLVTIALQTRHACRSAEQRQTGRPRNSRPREEPACPASCRTSTARPDGALRLGPLAALSPRTPPARRRHPPAPPTVAATDVHAGHQRRRRDRAPRTLLEPDRPARPPPSAWRARLGQTGRGERRPSIQQWDGTTWTACRASNRALGHRQPHPQGRCRASARHLLPRRWGSGIGGRRMSTEHVERHGLVAGHGAAPPPPDGSQRVRPVDGCVTCP